MLKRRAGGLYLDGVSLERLASRFGTPLYVYSAETIRSRYGTLAAAFRRTPLICYAMKANANRSVCRLLAKAGAGVDVVSGGELVRALDAGFPPHKIVFSGVGKTMEELELAVKTGIFRINVESREELERLMTVAARLKRQAPVAIRLNPDVDPRTHPHISTGKAENKFGVEFDEALHLYRLASSCVWTPPRGVQTHIGSQITDPAPYRLAARSVARLLRCLERGGIRLETVDFGGGLGIPYQSGRSIDPRVFARTLETGLAGYPETRLVIEPGRWLVADAGVLLARVLYRKKTTKRRFVIVDAAMNDLARPALYDGWHPVEPARLRRGQRLTVDIVGPICETGDFLARQRRLAPCEPGDILAILKAGAYGFAMSSQYNSRPRAAEVLVDGGKARLARRRETLKDLVRHEL